MQIVIPAVKSLFIAFFPCLAFLFARFCFSRLRVAWLGRTSMVVFSVALLDDTPRFSSFFGPFAYKSGRFT